MMTETTRRAFGLDDGSLLKWRAGGRGDKLKTLLFVAGVALMILLGFRMLSGAPLPQYNGRRMRGPMMRMPGPDKQLARLSKRLHLTRDQRAKIKPILKEQYEKLRALRRDTTLSRQERMARFRRIHGQTFDQIRPLLTAKQQIELRKMRRARARRRGQERPM
jgi:Spy/CpxP family protein refolding chaperone